MNVYRNIVHRGESDDWPPRLPSNSGRVASFFNELRAPPASALETDVPSSADILGAMKVTGRLAGGWSLGVMGTVTRAEDALYLAPDGSRQACT
jgi:hypothetical protein